MNKFVKITALFSSFLISSLFSYKATYFIGEKYFFDKLFYKKSEKHGYILAWPVLTKKNSKAVEKRIEDLRLLVPLPGQRDKRILGIQNDKTYKIAVIGDSYAYGVGVKQSQRFSELLEKRLNKIYPTQIFTLALPGENILDDYAKFLLAEQYLDIDLYIITILENDILLDLSSRYPNIEYVYKTIKPMCQGKEISYNDTVHNNSYEERLKNVYYPALTDKYANICFFEEIIKRMVKDNVIFYSFQPIPKENNDPESNQTTFEKHALILNKYLSIIRDQHGYAIDSSNISNYIYETVSQKESHPSKKVHQFYANSLFKEITENTKWKFPVLFSK